MNLDYSGKIEQGSEKAYLSPSLSREIAMGTTAFFFEIIERWTWKIIVN